jgi:multidrug resistance efflux pump
MTDTTNQPPANTPAAPAAAPAPAATAPASPAPQAPDGRHQFISAVAFASVALVGVLVILYAWRLPPFSTPLVTTENALVRGQVTLIGTQLNGYVVAVNVQDFQTVTRGQLLVQIDDRLFQQKVDQAKAQLAAQQATLDNSAQQRRSAEASIALAEAALINTEAQGRKSRADLTRVDQLVADGSLSVREQDQSRAAQATTVAGVAQARANLEIARVNLRSVIVNHAGLEAAVANAGALLKGAQIDLDNTRIVAPEDGQLGQVTVRKGAYVSSGASLMGLVPRQMWVIANYKETQMDGVRVGQLARFHVDALNGARLSGHVERISPATGSEFSVLPADNATGNYVKIAQRIPVRIGIDANQAEAARLRPGMSVVVSVDTSTTPRDEGRSVPVAPVAPASPPPATVVRPALPADQSVGGAGVRP